MGFKRIKTTYTPKSVMRSLELKFYAEQVKGFDPKKLEGLSKEQAKKAQVDCLKEVLKRLRKVFSSSKYPAQYWFVFGIVHDSDTIASEDDWFLPSDEKPHVHIYIQGLHDKKIQISTVFNLLGINQRAEDAEMWKHGIKPIDSIAKCALYSTHETEQAIKDGKTTYPFLNIYTNNREHLLDLRGDGKQAQKSFKQADWEEVYRLAYEHGYDLGAWKDFYKTLPNTAKEKKSKVGIAREAYEDGIDAHIAEDNSCVRTCIYIQGERNQGKSHATKYAVTKMYGDLNLDISDGGSGQFDDIDPSYKAIFVDDYTLPSKSLRGISDDKIGKLYRRNNSNPYCAAELLVITSNTTFEEWTRECGMETCKLIDDQKEATESYRALKSRFFICRVEQNRYGINELRPLSTPDRGDIEKLEVKKKTFETFRDYFNESVSSYKPNIGYINPDDLYVEVVDEDTKYQYDMAVGETAQYIAEVEQTAFEEWEAENIIIFK